MRNRKPLVSALLALVLILSLAACGGPGNPPASQSGEAQTGEGSADASADGGSEPTGEVEKILYHFMVFANAPADLQMVQEAINEITVPEIGVEVELQATAVGSYPEQISLAIAGNEPLDVLCTIPSGAAHFNNMTSQNQLIALNDLLDTHGTGIKEALGEKYLSGTTIDGNIYGVASVYGKATKIFCAMRTDLLEEYGLTAAAASAASISDLEAIFTAANEANPNLPVIVGSSGGNILNLGGLFMTEDSFSAMPLFDTLGDSTNMLAIAMVDDPGTVVSYYESDWAKQTYDKTREWYNNGWVYMDSATTQETCQELVKQGRGFGYFFQGEVDANSAQRNATGYDMTLVEIATNYVQTEAIRKFTWGIPVTSSKPEAAMKFLNMTYTDERIVNLLDYGVEGVHYVANTDGTITYAEGLDATNSGWGLTTTFLFGNQLLAKVWEGNDLDIREQTKALDDAAQVSPLLGFSFDNSGVVNELSALSNVIQQYRPALQSGVASEQNYNDFVDALKAAGLDTYVQAVQEQLNAFNA